MVDDELIVDPELDAAVREGLEGVVAGDVWLDLARPAHAGRAFWQAGVNELVGPFLFARQRDVDAPVHPLANQVLEIRALVERSGETAALAAGVEEALGRDGQISKAREGRVVPQDAPAAARNQEGNHEGAVVLPKVKVVSLQVQQAEVVLTETVESFVGMGEPLLAHVLRVLALDSCGHERPAAILLLKDGSAGGVEERDPARGEVDVIEPHHRNILRYTQACFSQGS